MQSRGPFWQPPPNHTGEILRALKLHKGCELCHVMESVLCGVLWVPPQAAEFTVTSTADIDPSTSLLVDDIVVDQPSIVRIRIRLKQSKPELFRHEVDIQCSAG